jgi:hypothetical protein
MTNDEIIETVKEAGDDWDHTLPSDKEFLIAFAQLIAKKQKQLDAEICMKAGPQEFPNKLISQGYAAAILAQGDNE